MVPGVRQDLVYIRYPIYASSYWKSHRHSALLMGNPNRTSSHIKDQRRGWLRQPEILNDGIKYAEKWLKASAEGCSKTHTSALVIFCCPSSQSHLPLASPLGPKFFHLEIPDPSPHPSPQAPLGRPWQSRWLMADGAMWTNQEVRQEGTTPSSICQELGVFGF